MGLDPESFSRSLSTDCHEPITCKYYDRYETRKSSVFELLSKRKRFDVLQTFIPPYVLFQRSALKKILYLMPSLDALLKKKKVIAMPKFGEVRTKTVGSSSLPLLGILRFFEEF